jgi:hypothetical protein
MSNSTFTDFLNESKLTIKSGSNDLNLEQMIIAVKTTKDSLVEGLYNMDSTLEKNYSKKQKAYQKAINTVRILQDDLKAFNAAFN